MCSRFEPIDQASLSSKAQLLPDHLNPSAEKNTRLRCNEDRVMQKMVPVETLRAKFELEELRLLTERAPHPLSSESCVSVIEGPLPTYHKSMLTTTHPPTRSTHP